MIYFKHSPLKYWIVQNWFLFVLDIFYTPDFWWITHQRKFKTKSTKPRFQYRKCVPNNAIWTHFLRDKLNVVVSVLLLFVKECGNWICVSSYDFFQCFFLVSPIYHTQIYINEMCVCVCLYYYKPFAHSYGEILSSQFTLTRMCRSK